MYGHEPNHERADGMDRTLSIEIDGEVWEAMKSQAEPFVDTPNDVLRRLLGLGDSPDSSARSDNGHRDWSEPGTAPRTRTQSRTRRGASRKGKTPNRAPRG